MSKETQGRFPVYYNKDSEEGRYIERWLLEQDNASKSIRKLILGQPLTSDIRQDLEDLKKQIQQLAQGRFVEKADLPEPVFEDTEIKAIEENIDRIENKVSGVNMFFED
jgi:hypothetical protein